MNKTKQTKQLKPFDYLSSINKTKIDLMENEQCEKIYNSFLVNRGLSYHNDTIMYAELINRYSSLLSKKMQYHFYLNIVSKSSRYSKWYKTEKQENIEVIQAYYNYNHSNAVDALKLLSDEQLNIIKGKLNHGGK